MKIFVYEMISAGGLGDDVSPSLRREGWAMLAALASDFARIVGYEVRVLLAEDRSVPGVTRFRRDDGPEFDQFRAIVSASDAVLVVAPEFENLLAQRCEAVLTLGKPLLGCGLAAIRLAGDKWALHKHWQLRGVPVPETEIATAAPGVRFPAVIKPRDGAGSLATHLVSDSTHWPAIWDACRQERPQGEFLVQSYCRGRACSVAFLIGPGQRIPLLPTEQILSKDGRFQYLGGLLPLAPAEAERACRLGALALRDIDELKGYVGVDLILGTAADGSEDRVIEVNPRPTTSFVGLRTQACGNLAEVWVHLLQHRAGLAIAWKSVRTRFTADGVTELAPP